MLNARFLEAMNVAWFVAAALIAWLFICYIVRHWRDGRTPPLNAAIALGVYFTGEAVVRGWVWYWRHLLNRGADVSWMTSAPILAVGGAAALGGGLCLMRVFTMRYGNVPWVATGMLAVAAGLLTLVF
jgi:hypothetical protein